MPSVNTPHKGACHCRSVQFEVKLLDGLNTALRCTCSICRMRGAVMVMAKIPDLTITKGADKVSEYQFGTNTAKHYFCSVCGVYTHHQRRMDPTTYAVNSACLEGISPFDFAAVRVVDGVNHPKDSGGGAFRDAGVLKFVRE